MGMVPTPLTLLPPQAEVVSRGLLDSGFSCVLQMPTGSGKTWLSELAIETTLQRGYRAIYLTPLRALATELLSRWRQRFPHSKVGIFTGEYGIPGHDYPTPFRDAQLMIMTPERLDACIRAWRSHWHWLPDVDLVVVDELHLLADPYRGPRLEGAITRMRRLNPFVRFLGLSATLGNRTELADWLGGVEYISTWRPIPIKWRVVRYRKATDKPQILAQHVMRNVGRGGKSLVFVQSRRRAEQLSTYLRDKGLRAHHHHAGLVHERRQVIEAGFRAHEIDVLVATATLEMGLNLPVRQVVLYDLQQFDGQDFRPLTIQTVWQRAGRAGRPGLDDSGEVVLLAPIWDQYVGRYERGVFEPVLSGLASLRPLVEQILIEVATGMSQDSHQVRTAMEQSLAMRQGLLPEVDKVIWQMSEADMLRLVEEEHRLRLKATRLGHIAVRHFLLPSSIVLFKRMLDGTQAYSFFDLLLIAAASEDCQPILPVDFEELDALAHALACERSFLLQLPSGEIAGKLGIGGKRLLSALKIALVVRAWTRLGDADLVAVEYGCYAFEVLRLAESIERLLIAMRAVHCDPEAAKQPDDTVVGESNTVQLGAMLQALASMVRAGLDETAVSLTLIKGIGTTLARRLKAAGITDVEALGLAEVADVAQIRGVSEQRAQRWISVAESLTDSHSAYHFRDAGPRVNLLPPGWPAEIDPYRLRRALDLTVSGPDGAIYGVSGGLEPHRVMFGEDGPVCDCADAARQHVCKHVIAVRLRRGDLGLKQLVEQLEQGNAGEQLDLFVLWVGQHSVRRRER